MKTEISEYGVEIKTRKKTYLNRQPLHSIEEAIECAMDALEEYARYAMLRIFRNPGNVDLISVFDSGNAFCIEIKDNDPDRFAVEEFAMAI